MTPEIAVKQYLPLVRKIVWSAVQRFPHVSHLREDLIQDGLIGLVVAARKFDPTRGVKFITYAHYWIFAYVRAGALQGFGQTSGRHNNGHVIRAAWAKDPAAIDEDGAALSPDTTASSSRPDHLIELKDLSEKMFRAAQKASLSKRDLDIFLTRTSVDRTYDGGAMTRGGQVDKEERAQDGFPALGAKYGITKQAASLIEKKVSAAVRAWGEEILKEAA